MDSDAYSKRTDKIIEILEADERLDDGLGQKVTITKGLPDERMQAASGCYVYVHWEETTAHNRRWNAGARRDVAPARVAIWYVVDDYSTVANAETLFETLAANIVRVLSDDEVLQLADYWTNLEIVGGGMMGLPLEHSFWRVGKWNVNMTFREEIN